MKLKYFFFDRSKQFFRFELPTLEKNHYNSVAIQDHLKFDKYSRKLLHTFTEGRIEIIEFHLTCMHYIIIWFLTSDNNNYLAIKKIFKSV